MRIAYFCACFVTAVDCAARAQGIRDGGIFPADVLWLNWILAAAWLAIGIHAFWWRPA